MTHIYPCFHISCSQFPPAVRQAHYKAQYFPQAIYVQSGNLWVQRCVNILLQYLTATQWEQLQVYQVLKCHSKKMLIINAMTDKV